MPLFECVTLVQRHNLQKFMEPLLLELGCVGNSISLLLLATAAGSRTDGFS